MIWKPFEETWAKYRYILLLALFGLLFAVPGGQLLGAPLEIPSADGQSLFQEKCAACHTIGGGNLAGPDLKGVVARRDRAWLTRWLAAPDQMLAQKDPIATKLLQDFNNLPMPNMALNGEQVASLIAYLEGSVGGATAPPAGQAAGQPVAKGDPVIGKDLFTGAISFQNGGSPCIACHSIAGIGALGGGALGPDLSAVYGKYGENGMASVLASLPFPTMSPIFSGRPLAADEQAHLAAFLQAASVAERPVETVGQLGLLGAVGAAVFIGVTNLFFRRRLGQVRRPMVAEPSAHRRISRGKR